ncbi:MAG TPA: adenylate/guanylate cyclase domain-containing protein [Chitinophagales bacterium]|nr:adenylate/guanylate cyclase domain-containing protein [Chitinophagales bacterium]
MKTLFNPYLTTIENTLKQSKLSKSFDSYSGLGSIPQNKKFMMTEGLDFPPGDQLAELARRAGAQPNGHGVVGMHPDFAYLRGTREFEYHNITSTFIDIKGSTNLYNRYNEEQIFVITNTILSAAIHTCTVFGGHIQRLQGDGVFVYFGGKTIDENSAVLHALLATATFTYFVKNDLKRVFELNGIENIYTRIGIDIGKDDSEVLWVVTGTPTLNELTTISLHTSLACKLQSHAKSNGILVGENVFLRVLEIQKFFSHFTDDKTLEGKFHYKPYEFNWSEFLKSLPYLYVGLDGELDFIDQPKKLLNSEEERLNRLRDKMLLVKTGDAYTDRNSVITNNPVGVKNQPHRFHFNDKI